MPRHHPAQTPATPRTARAPSAPKTTRTRMRLTSTARRRRGCIGRRDGARVTRSSSCVAIAVATKIVRGTQVAATPKLRRSSGTRVAPTRGAACSSTEYENAPCAFGNGMASHVAWMVHEVRACCLSIFNVPEQPEHPEHPEHAEPVSDRNIRRPGGLPEHATGTRGAVTDSPCRHIPT